MTHVTHDSRTLRHVGHQAGFAWGTTAYGLACTRGAWDDSIGAGYSQWMAMTAYDAETLEKIAAAEHEGSGR